MSKRFGILDRLRDNWPGQFDHPRIAFIEKELRDFDDEILNIAVTHVIRTETFPPKLAAFFAKCREIKQAHTKEEKARKPVPGDVVDGEKTLTPLEALEELKKMKTKVPEAFDHRIKVPQSDFKKKIETLCNRWYVMALHTCVAWDPSIKVPSDLNITKAD